MYCFHSKNFNLISVHCDLFYYFYNFIIFIILLKIKKKPMLVKIFFYEVVGASDSVPFSFKTFLFE